MLDKQDREASLCVVCEDRPVYYKIVECEHANLCEPCLQLLIETAKRRNTGDVSCPVCRGPMRNVVPIASQVRSAAALAHEQQVLQLSLQLDDRLATAIRLAASGFTLRSCLLALAESADNAVQAATLLTTSPPSYVRVEHMKALFGIVERVLEDQIKAVSGVV